MEKYITFSVGGLRLNRQLELFAGKPGFACERNAEGVIEINKVHFERQRSAFPKGNLPLRIRGLMAAIQRDQAAGQREVLQQTERRAHLRRRVRTHTKGLGCFWL